MNKLIFDNIGAKIKTLAKVLFYAAIIFGIIGLIVGLFTLLDAVLNGDRFTFEEAWHITQEDAERWPSYYGYTYNAVSTLKNGLLLIVYSIAAIPTYAFGELLYSCQEIKKNTAAMIQQKNEEK